MALWIKPKLLFLLTQTSAHKSPPQRGPPGLSHLMSLFSIIFISTIELRISLFSGFLSISSTKSHEGRAFVGLAHGLTPLTKRDMGGAR